MSIEFQAETAADAENAMSDAEVRWPAVVLTVALTTVAVLVVSFVAVTTGLV